MYFFRVVQVPFWQRRSGCRHLLPSFELECQYSDSPLTHIPSGSVRSPCLRDSKCGCLWCGWKQRCVVDYSMPLASCSVDFAEDNGLISRTASCLGSEAHLDKDCFRCWVFSCQHSESYSLYALWSQAFPLSRTARYLTEYSEAQTELL